MRVRQTLLRLLICTLATLGSMIVTVLVLTIADLYLVGHGYQSINREVVSVGGAGISMSISDIVLLLIGLATWCAVWFLMRRAGRQLP